jgi:hypothetical protein
MRGMRHYVGREVVVNSDSGDLRGKLFEVTRDMLELRETELVQPNGPAVALRGIVIVPLARVQSIQVSE